MYMLRNYDALTILIPIIFRFIKALLNIELFISYILHTTCKIKHFRRFTVKF